MTKYFVKLIENKDCKKLQEQINHFAKVYNSYVIDSDYQPITYHDETGNEVILYTALVSFVRRG